MKKHAQQLVSHDILHPFYRDELTMAQQHLLRDLVDASGNPLNPTEWRVQTTAQGELIVVRLDPTPSGSRPMRGSANES